MAGIARIADESEELVLVRLVLLAAVVLGAASLGFSYSSAPAEVALAQDGDADLVATIEALQKQVADQDARVAALERSVDELRRVVGALTAETPESNPEAEVEEASEATHTLTGSFSILSNGERVPSNDNFMKVFFTGTDNCFGQNGFEDLQGEMSVVVMDGAGTVIATGRTEEGLHDQFENVCEFAFTVEDVPTSAFYSIRIGRRDGPTYSIEELEAMGWNIELSIG
jgi:hypothetical protein